MKTATTTRDAELRQMLHDRQREIQNDVQSRIRDVRADRPADGRDELEQSDADSNGNVELALLQMRAEMLSRIDEALGRLEAGKFGCCFECEAEISETRLRALPFAVRCKACEERREEQYAQSRQLAQRRGGTTLFPEVASS